MGLGDIVKRLLGTSCKARAQHHHPGNTSRALCHAALQDGRHDSW
jgi:hypothetical protein